MANKNNDKEIYCSFCGKPQDMVSRLIAGSGAYICDRCVELCMNIIEQSGEVERDRDHDYYKPSAPQLSDEDFAELLKPKEIKAILDEYVIGQEDAKVTLSVAVYNHYKRAFAGDDSVDFAKSNVLLLGPTGVGKTLLAQTLARALDVPFAIADATTLTEAGYVGEDVENILLKLIQAADYDIERAERGIIYIDEIDKIARKGGDNTAMTRDVSGEGVQQSLLKILEGTTVHVPMDNARKQRGEADGVEIDTRDILFICGGAFVGLDKIVERRVGAHETGFGAAWRTQTYDPKDLLAMVTADDLAEFGLLPEFIGRLPVVTALNELGIDELRQILTTPANALVKQYRKLFDVDGVDLVFTDDAIDRIARISLDKGTGARGLRSIIERTLETTMFELPNRSDIAQVIVDANAVDGTAEPQYVSAQRPRLRINQ